MAELEPTWLAPLFDAEVVCVQGQPELVDAQLFPDEIAYLARAVPKRRAEFGAVRVCARRALAALGIAPMSLAPYPDRAPRWPEGVIGSLTHTAGYCAAVVVRADVLRSVGVDAERERELSPDLLRMICTERERAVLAERPEGARDALAYFAAKEAFYKCQYPLTRTYLDFRDVELDLDFESGRYSARVIKALPDKPSWLDETEGRFLRRDGLVLCGSQLRH